MNVVVQGRAWDHASDDRVDAVNVDVTSQFLDTDLRLDLRLLGSIVDLLTRQKLFHSGYFLMGQARHTLLHSCNSCKPGSTVDTTMKTPEHRSQACPRDMNDYLGSRNEINQKITMKLLNRFLDSKPECDFEVFVTWFDVGTLLYFQDCADMPSFWTFLITKYQFLIMRLYLLLGTIFIQYLFVRVTTSILWFSHVLFPEYIPLPLVHQSIQNLVASLVASTSIPSTQIPGM
ncbi:hypothetical protein SFRURICE_010196 [Spodoptera frugiperda]|nr:hypothetical protein SFRURICE_010196 [Spodoptera frugiperda]